jgi:hypothetical protein
VIMAIGLVSISTLFVGAIISDTKAERISLASHRARKEMERLKGATYSNAVVNTTVFPTTSGYTILETGAAGTGRVSFSVPELPNATGEIDITYYDSGAGIYPNLKRVVVSLSWLGGKRTRGSVVLVSYLGNRPT